MLESTAAAVVKVVTLIQRRWAAAMVPLDVACWAVVTITTQERRCSNHATSVRYGVLPIFPWSCRLWRRERTLESWRADDDAGIAVHLSPRGLGGLQGHLLKGTCHSEVLPSDWAETPWARIVLQPSLPHPVLPVKSSLVARGRLENWIRCLDPVYLIAEGSSICLGLTLQVSTDATSTQGWTSAVSTADAVSVVLLHSRS